MLCHPMSRDFHPPANPGFVVPLHMVHEAREGVGATRSTNQSSMQTDGHHFRLTLAFSVQLIERRAQIEKEIFA